MKSSAAIFISTSDKDAAGVGSGAEFWVNIDPVNTCAAAPSRQPTQSWLGIISSPQPGPSPTRPERGGYNCCEWVAHLFPETASRPPGVSARLG